MDALQDAVDLVQAGGGGQVDAGVQEGFLLRVVDVGALQSLEDAHGDLVVMREDPLGRVDFLDSGGLEPLGEELLAFAAAPAGVCSGLDGVDLLLSPAVLQQSGEEAVVAHLRHGGVVAGHDEDLVAGLHALGDEALGGLGADAVVVALDAGDGGVGDGVDDTVKHNEGDAAVGQLLHGGGQLVVLRQDDDGVSGLVLDQVFDLGDLVGRIGGGDDLGGVLAFSVDFGSFLLSVGHDSTGPAVVGVGDQDRDLLGAGSGGGGSAVAAAAGSQRKDHDQCE